MARLFITKREINFISDITKEIVKDVVGQKVYYYPVSETKTKSHEVYDESLKKVFDNPINVDVLVNSEFQTETKINKFGIDTQFTLEVYIQHRDMIEKGINPSIGDYFSFGTIFYEITEYKYMRTIYGQAENIDGVSLIGTRVRESQFKALTNGPTDIKYNDPDAVQDTFVQQRGYATDANGEETGDVRDLVKNGVLEEPLTGPKQVSPAGDSTGVGSAFYDEE